MLLCCLSVPLSLISSCFLLLPLSLPFPLIVVLAVTVDINEVVAACCLSPLDLDYNAALILLQAPAVSLSTIPSPLFSLSLAPGQEHSVPLVGLVREVGWVGWGCNV